jgi:metal-responsive CopG/Arc/MetJ family transcriptional regulator
MRSILSISLPENLSTELEKFAKSTGRSKSDIVKESVSLYLWEARLRKMQKRFGAKAKRVGIVNEENIFKVVSC